MIRSCKRTVAVILCAIMSLAVCSSTLAANGSQEKGFSDIEGHWAQNAIEKWAEYGIINGYPDGRFGPNNNITRAEFAAIVNRIAKYETAENYLYGVPEGAWYAADANALTSVRVLMAKNGGADLAKTYTTREEVAYAMYQILRVPAGGQRVSFKDAGQISSWAKDAVNTLCSADIIHGYPDGRFGPKDKITRAEFITILDNTFELYINKPGEYTYTGNGKGMIFVGSKDVTLRIDSDAAGTGPIPVQVFFASYLGIPSGVKVNVGDKNKIIAIRGGTISDLMLDEARTQKVIYAGTLLSQRDSFFPLRYFSGNDKTEPILVGLGGMLNYVNGATQDTVNKLSTHIGGERGIFAQTSAMRILSESWGIVDKESLEEVVNWLLYEGGHNSLFFEEAADVKLLSPAQRAQYTDAYMFVQLDAWSEKWGDTGIVAWDICRASSVLQWAYSAGYITRNEALSMGKDAAVIAMDTFDSWEDLYDNYLDGYAWWSISDISKGRPREDYWEALNGFYPDVFRDELLIATK